MTKRQKLVKTDGLGPYEIKRIRSAVRQVWYQSHCRKLVIKRCTGKDGFTYCEKCKKRTPKLKVDHIVNVGDVDDGFIPRMFVPSRELQGLCPPCHNEKTNHERKSAAGICLHPWCRRQRLSYSEKGLCPVHFNGVSKDTRKKKRSFSDEN